MSVEVIAIGGYQEVGKNMTAVKIGEDVIIFDMGIHLDRISMHEDTDIDRMHSLDLIERGVIPEVSYFPTDIWITLVQLLNWLTDMMLH